LNPNTTQPGERVSYIKHTPAKKSLSGSLLEEARVISLTPRMVKNETNIPELNRTPLSVIPEHPHASNYTQRSPNQFGNSSTPIIIDDAARSSPY
jgi:hypothetical protein